MLTGTGPVLGLLAGLVAGQGQRQDLDPATFPLAKCNDGTQANYYHQPGEPHGKFVINLQGGAFCGTVESCNDRCAHTDLCTAQTDQEIEMQRPLAGLDNEPYFDYWHVFVHYCSSDVWSGTRAASQETGGYNFYGKHIVSAVLEDLSARFGLLEASHIVLTGGSAGAQGTVLNCDDFSAQVWAANPDIDVRCVADAPEYFPPEVHTEDCANRAPGFQNHLTEFWGREMDKSCLEFAAEQGVEDVGELCGLTTNFAQFITTPLAILSSHEDSAFTHDFGCEPDPHSPEHEQFRAEWMAAHNEQATALMVDFPEIAFYAPNCRMHTLVNPRSEEMLVEGNESGEATNVQTFVRTWLEGDGRTHQHAIDDITKENPTCPE